MGPISYGSYETHYMANLNSIILQLILQQLTLLLATSNHFRSISSDERSFLGLLPLPAIFDNEGKSPLRAGVDDRSYDRSYAILGKKEKELVNFSPLRGWAEGKIMRDGVDSSTSADRS